MSGILWFWVDTLSWGSWTIEHGCHNQVDSEGVGSFHTAPIGLLSAAKTLWPWWGGLVPCSYLEGQGSWYVVHNQGSKSTKLGQSRL